MEATIDKLDYTKRFEAVNFDRTQAEELAEALKDVSEYIIADLKDRDREYATKGDLIQVKNDLKGDIDKVKTELKGDIALLRKDIEAMPDKIMWNIVKYGTAIYAFFKVGEYILQLIAKKAGLNV